MKNDNYTYIGKMLENAKRPIGSVDRRFLNFFKVVKKVEHEIDDPEEEEVLHCQPRSAKAYSIKK